MKIRFKFNRPIVHLCLLACAVLLFPAFAQDLPSEPTPVPVPAPVLPTTPNPVEIKPAPVPAPADDTSKPLQIVVPDKPAPYVVDYKKAVPFPYDQQRLKKRPNLDGNISDTEWDPLYTISDGPVKGTVYLNWDDENLYVAVKTDKPGWFVFDLDANGDGWLKGADNLEIAVAPLNMDNKPVISARILDTVSDKNTPVWNDKVVDVHSLPLVQKAAGSGQIIELAIPRGIAGLNLRVNAPMLVRADLLPVDAVYTPTQPYEPHILLDITLVASRTVSAPGVTPRLTLEDAKLIPGQNLTATLELTSQLGDSTVIRSVTWEGNGAAAEILKSLREVNIPALKAMKSLKLKYSSPLPTNTVPGFYQFTATAQLDSGKVAIGTVSFSVVEPFNIQIIPEPDPININTVGGTQLKAYVEIYSAVPHYASGNVEMEVPSGWIIKGRTKKEFSVEREDATGRFPFYILIPNAAQPGDYMLNATITWQKRTWKVHRSVHVVGTTSDIPAGGAKSVIPTPVKTGK